MAATDLQQVDSTAASNSLRLRPLPIDGCLLEDCVSGCEAHDECDVECELPFRVSVQGWALSPSALFALRIPGGWASAMETYTLQGAPTLSFQQFPLIYIIGVSQ